MISVKEFERDNLKFQKFKDQKKKENINENAYQTDSRFKDGPNEISYTSEQIVAYTTRANPQNDSKTSLDFSQTSSKFFVQSIPNHLRDIQTKQAVDTSKGDESEQMSVNESYKSYLV